MTVQQLKTIIRVFCLFRPDKPFRFMLTGRSLLFSVLSTYLPSFYCPSIFSFLFRSSLLAYPPSIPLPFLPFLSFGSVSFCVLSCPFHSVPVLCFSSFSFPFPCSLSLVEMQRGCGMLSSRSSQVDPGIVQDRDSQSRPTGAPRAGEKWQCAFYLEI